MATGLRKLISPFAAAVLALAAAAALLAVQPGAAQAGAAQAAGPSDWTQYAFDTSSSGYNAAETTVTAASAGSLKTDWTATGSVGSTDQPLVVGSTVYWASWDGNLHASALSTGASLWTTQLGYLDLPGHGPPQAGISSTPLYGSINGTPVLWVWDGGNSGAGDGEVAAFAVNATTGAIIWRTNVTSASPDVMAWGSVKEFNGALYVSTASLDDNPVIPSRMYKLDPATGAIDASQSIGGGVWGTSTFDPSTGDMFVPVGGPSPSAGTNHYQFALLELDASTLAIVSSWTVPASQQTGDSDFGSSPTLFTGASGTPMVGLGSKNGRYYAFNRADIAAGPVWTDMVAVAGNNPNTQGTISPPVFDGTTLYVAGGDTTVGATSCNGSVRAINPATGAYKWQYCASGHILGALAAAPGILAVPDGSSLVILSMAAGAVLYSHAAGATIDGAPSIADGHVLYPAMNGSVTVLSPAGGGGGVTPSDLKVADTANAAHWSIQSDFTSGATLYGDRTYTVGTVPSALQGDAWIRDANASKAFTGTPLVTFTISRAATVYVAVDTRLGERPWMTSAGWATTGTTVTDHEGGATRTFAVYSKSYPTGPLSLGPDADTTSKASMYLIIVH